MKPDENMITEALDGARGKFRDTMLERVEVYRAACHLAGGRNPARSAYWQEKAARLAASIKRSTYNRTAPGVGREQCA